MIGMLAVSTLFLSSTSVSKPLPPGMNTSNVIAFGSNSLALLTRFSSRLSHGDPVFGIQVAGKKLPGGGLVVYKQDKWLGAACAQRNGNIRWRVNQQRTGGRGSDGKGKNKSAAFAQLA